MSPRGLVFTFALGVVATAAPLGAVAHAQAPGDQAACEVAAPVVPLPVMARRWAVSFGIGSATYAPTASPDDKSQFSIGELALRYRATPHLELELAGTGGQLANGSDLQVHSFTASLRYRMRPGHAWDWYLLGGIGATELVTAEASDADRNAAARGQLQLGAGVERRFGNFGITAEIKMIALASPNNAQAITADPNSSPAPAGTIASSMSAMSSTPSPGGASGGEFTVGVAYYF
jgi:hypothetical protein